jgi:glucosamine-6-phosphate deaminase
MIKVYDNNKNLSQNLALEILTKLKNKKKLVLGCPGGRSLKKTYYYLGILSFKHKISLDKLTLVMMDEYVLKKNNKFFLVNPQNHYSCVKFANNIIKKLLNYKKNKSNSLKGKNILFPSVDKPDNYDKIIRDLGGIDIFLLASGSSDGHVAFNNAYSSINQKTHITKLSMSTRTDNMKTFPQFNNLNEVPKFGLTVGLKTIFSLSKTAILVLVGKEKKQAFKKISSLKKFDKSWPASIIYKCKNNKIYIDKSIKS